jgi:hypothetical protein
MQPEACFKCYFLLYLCWHLSKAMEKQKEERISETDSIYCIRQYTWKSSHFPVFYDFISFMWLNISPSNLKVAALLHFHSELHMHWSWMDDRCRFHLSENSSPLSVSSHGSRSCRAGRDAAQGSTMPEGMWLRMIGNNNGIYEILTLW